MRSIGFIVIVCMVIVVSLAAIQNVCAEDKTASYAAPASTVAPLAPASNPAKDYRHQIGNKAERGVTNVLFGWTEIPKRVVDITKESRNPIWGLAAGVYQGTGKAFARTTSGLCDVATCGFKPGEKPLVQPDMDTAQAGKARVTTDTATK
ncbi:MAG: exosortase system-associated protein, TIGR04073 family [Candidatus Omnitrophica bacterium]|nr:exosortase system-associated protein, TIGR04073 family [Candidatus Omnitrophota bacterium]